ncbi:hypothetical protein FF1_043078 [Malus domestica]
MARPSAVTHLHLLCDQDLVSSREDDDELKEEEIVDDQDSVSSKPPKGIALQSPTLEHSWTFWGYGLILFGWASKSHSRRNIQCVVFVITGMLCSSPFSSALHCPSSFQF